jgi:predicted GNAT family acetyltransferase
MAGQVCRQEAGRSRFLRAKAAGFDLALAEKVAISSHLAQSAGALPVHPLTTGQESEVMAFLSQRPVHTIIMSGLIRDNGLESSLNRGVFYACRNRQGELIGVALIGHLTLIETNQMAALTAFARLARAEVRLRTIIGEEERIERFWSAYLSFGLTPYRRCRELLFEQHYPIEVRQSSCGLRLAVMDDLALVAASHAQMAEQESGASPMQTDRRGFLERCARRIKQGRVWVWRERERLLFKADVIAETPEAAYLEGVYVHPQARGKGYGLSSLAELSQRLLARTKIICLLVNEQNISAQLLYRRAGYKLQSVYSAIFVRP